MTGSDEELVARILYAHRDDNGWCETCRFDVPPRWYGERYDYPCPTLRALRELDPDRFANGLRLVAAPVDLGDPT
jgi:hypothetical protein